MTPAKNLIIVVLSGYNNARVEFQMLQAITVTLPAEVQRALDEVSQNEGLTRDEVVRRAIEQHIFLRQFRLLRERMSAKARSLGIVTDEDVFDRVT